MIATTFAGIGGIIKLPNFQGDQTMHDDHDGWMDGWTDGWMALLDDINA